MDFAGVLAHLSIANLEELSHRDAACKEAVHTELYLRPRRMLTRFVNNADGFLRAIDNVAVVSGSFALYFIEGPTNWEPNDLDVYTTFEGFASVVRYLVEVEGYAENEEERAARERMNTLRRQVHEELVARLRAGQRVYVPRDIDTGICRVTTLYRGVRRVDVIRNRSASPTLALTKFWSTAQMNFISSRGFCCAYPRLTCRKVAVLNPSVLNPDGRPYDFVRHLTVKYQDRGFEFFDKWFQEEELGCLGFHWHALCPTMLRRFGDAHCLCGTFGNEPSSASFGYSDELAVSEWEVGWELGGWHGCKGAREESHSCCWSRATDESEDAASLEDSN